MTKITASKPPAGKCRADPTRSGPPISGRTRTSGKSSSRYSPRPAVGCREVLELLRMFQRLVAETHFWPNCLIDDAETRNKFNRDEDRARFDEIHGLATAYVDQLQVLSARDPERVGRYLNKPNVHRLIELYVHTIPAFGHVRNVQELLF